MIAMVAPACHLQNLPSPTRLGCRRRHHLRGSAARVPVAAVQTPRRELRMRSASSDNRQTDADAPATESQSSTGEVDLATKLAAAEAEAESLRQELEARKAAEGYAPKKYQGPKIDGIGYRETIFAAPSTAGKLASEEGAKAWGFSEAELLQSEGGLEKLRKEFGTDSDDRLIGKEEAAQIVTRRLLIGGGLAAVAAALSFVEIPLTVAPPQKPLSVYLVPLLRLQAALGVVKEQAEYLDALGLRSQLKLATGSLSSVKDNLLSATALLGGPSQAQAQTLAFDILGYLQQADYSNYFEGMGVPGPYQQTEYIKFSLASLEVAQQRLSQFLALIPNKPLEIAKEQFEQLGQS